MSDTEPQQPNTMKKARTLVTLAISACVLFAAGVKLKEVSHLSHAMEGIVSPRRLSTAFDSDGKHVETLKSELTAREKLFKDAPENEVKYWFEYSGPLQQYYYRYSKSREKADSFEGRDDSGVTSARFVPRPGGGNDYENVNLSNPGSAAGKRFKKNCAAFGVSDSNTNGVFGMFGGTGVSDKCRILFSINTVGAGAGATILWETQPPRSYADEIAKPWISEQATAATHLERGLAEMNAMCVTGAVEVSVQVLVCEPIPDAWTNWMEKQLPACSNKDAEVENDIPLQVVVMASPDTADTCHNLKSGFIEKKQQHLILAPPFLTTEEGAEKNPEPENEEIDPIIKKTHPDLLSSDYYDLHVAMKWSSLITMRSIFSFSQASADLATAAASSVEAPSNTSPLSKSKLLIPSFVRVSYVSEENNKVAKWRMHGDFFHPAAWEVSKDSYNTSWIPHSLSSGGVNGICEKGQSIAERRGLSSSRVFSGPECGQWWLFMEEQQRPTSPEIFAAEKSPPVVFGGSNYVWMLTEQQRQELVKIEVCKRKSGEDFDEANPNKTCGFAQGVIPLGDMESFLVNFMPNTALGKMHEKGKRPGYTKPVMTEKEREELRDRKQLKGQKDIEKALFDYNLYPAALMHKDATLKAARYRDQQVSKSDTSPSKIKSGYYDVSIAKPRDPVWGWCQAFTRRGLCTLFSEFLRNEDRCFESCGMLLDFSEI